MSEGLTPILSSCASIATSGARPGSSEAINGPQYVGSVMILSLLPVSNSTLPFGCLIKKKATGTVIFPVAPVCSPDLSRVSQPDENTESRIPCGESADAPATSHRQAPITVT